MSFASDVVTGFEKNAESYSKLIKRLSRMGVSELLETGKLDSNEISAAQSYLQGTVKSKIVEDDSDKGITPWQPSAIKPVAKPKKAVYGY
jgi:hypothetical protein